MKHYFESIPPEKGFQRYIIDLCKQKFPGTTITDETLIGIKEFLNFG